MSKHKINIFKIDDGEPTNPDERKGYVAQVSGFYNLILKKKLEAMIAEQVGALQNVQNSNEEDKIIKGTINGISLLMDWCDTMESEHLANKTEDNT